MDLARARYLVSPRGRDALAGLPADLASRSLNQLATLLRRDHPPEEAAALAEQVTLGARACDRFGFDAGFLLTADGLEMMTHPLVAVRRARRLASLGLPVADLTCGLGGELAACASAGMRAAGLERDGATALLAAANVPSAGVVRGDAGRAPFRLDRFAVVLDPSRREGGARRFDPAAFAPPLDVCLALLGEAKAGVLKAPPGIEHRHLPASAEIEFVQLGRSMREAAVWSGAGSVPGLRRAVHLPGGVELDSTAPQAPAACSPPGAFVFDPESCVTRAGLVRHLAYWLGARLMDSQVAYLTAESPAFHPLCATFRVIDVVPFSVARLKARLSEGGWSPVEIRRRAFPVEPDELRRLLGRREGTPVALFCTTVQGKRLVFVAERVSAPIEAVAGESQETAQGDRQ